MLIRAVLENKGSEVITIGVEKTVHDAVLLLNQHGIGALVVTGEAGDVAGIITERDLLREFGDLCLRLSEPQGLDGGAYPALVGDVMTKDVVVGVPGDRVDYVMSVMTKKHIRHLPVVEDGALVGMVSIGDMVNAHVTETEFEIRMLKDYVHGRTY